MVIGRHPYIPEVQDKLMKIIFSYRTDVRKERPVEAYPRCYTRVLREMGHQVLEIGDGHSQPILSKVKQKNYDIFLEMDNGRSQSGKLRFQLQKFKSELPSAVVLIDTHGNPELHEEVAKKYDHVFFAVYDKRDRFTGHPSAHWSPNATDYLWFNPFIEKIEKPEFDVGFFGSKGGLGRADMLKEICKDIGLSCDVRQVGKPYRHRWPQTCAAMLNCQALFNKGQKHDSPNQRVMESMTCRKLLFSDIDPRSGMSLLFEEGVDYLGYECKDELKDKMIWTAYNKDKAAEIANRGFEKVRDNHQVKNRVEKILEVVTK